MTKLVFIFIKVAFKDPHLNQNCIMQKVLGTIIIVAAAKFMVSVSQSYTSFYVYWI